MSSTALVAGRALKSMRNRRNSTVPVVIGLKGKSHGSLEHQALISLAEAAARATGWTIENERTYKDLGDNAIIPDLVISREEKSKQPRGRVTRRRFRYRIEVVNTCDRNLKHRLLGVDDVLVIRVEDYIYLPVYDAILNLKKLLE